MKDNPYPIVTENSLLIQIHPEGIFYAIVDENEQVVLQQTINMPAGKIKDLNFLEHFFGEPELRVLSENVSVVFENSNYKLIPNELFRSEDVALIYKMDIEENKDMLLNYNLLPQWGAHLVYEADSYLNDFLIKKFPEAEFEHHIFKLFRKNIKKNKDSVYVNLRKNAIDIIVVKDNNLLITNSYETKTEQDICYFILNIYEQLELDIDIFPLQLLSEKSITDSLIELIKQYIINVKSLT